MLRRILKVLLGVVLVVAGIAMLLLPGPGLLTIALGVALMLSQWPRGRRMLAALRVRLRERFGSRRVRRVERCLPDEVCPPQPTEQLRAIAASEAPPPPAPDELALTPDDVLAPDCEPEAR